MNRVRLALVALVSLAAVASARAETAQQEVILSLNPDELAKLMQDMGYRAEILKNDDGKRRIRTRIGGWNVTINLYSCGGNEDCKSIGIRTFFQNEKDRQLSFPNDWNRDKRFCKAYIDKDGDINLEYDILFTNGVTRDNIRSYFDVYEDQLKEFVDALRK